MSSPSTAVVGVVVIEVEVGVEVVREDEDEEEDDDDDDGYEDDENNDNDDDDNKSDNEDEDKISKNNKYTRNTNRKIVGDEDNDNNNDNDADGVNTDDVGYESWTEGSWCLLIPTAAKKTTYVIDDEGDDDVKVNSNNSTGINKKNVVCAPSSNEDSVFSKSESDSSRCFSSVRVLRSSKKPRTYDERSIDNIHSLPSTLSLPLLLSSPSSSLPPSHHYHHRNYSQSNKNKNTARVYREKKKLSQKSTRRIVTNSLTRFQFTNRYHPIRSYYPPENQNNSADVDVDVDIDVEMDKEVGTDATGSVTEVVAKVVTETIKTRKEVSAAKAALVWNGMFERFVSYKKKQPKFEEVPKLYIVDSVLHSWIYRQRTAYKKGILKEHHLQLLNSINFEF